MATTPDVLQKAVTDWTWLKTHVILLILVTCLAVGSVYGVEHIIAQHDAQKSTELASIAQTMEKQNESIQQQNTATIAALTQSNLLLQQQIGSLSSAIGTRDQQLQNTRNNLKVLSPPALSAKWGTVANEPVPNIDSNGNFIVPLPLALKSTDALVQVPVLQADISNQKDIISKQVQQLSNDDKALASEVAAHTSDNNTCVADKNSLNSQIVTLKADARVGKTKWFFIGLVAGYIGRVLTHP
jgi:hypothetical protein